MNDVTEPLAPSAEPDRKAFALAWGLAATLLATSLLVAGPIQALHLPYGIWFLEMFLFLGLTWMVLRMVGRHPLHYPRAGVPGGAALGMAFLAGALNLIAVGFPLNALMHNLFPRDWIEIFNQSQVFERQRPVDLAIIVAGIGFAAPICEEYFFRGVFVRGMTAAGMTPGRTLFVSAFVFSAFHLNPVVFLPLFEVGLLFGFLYLKTGSLWPPVMAHAANNLVSTASFFVIDAVGGPEAAGAGEAPDLLKTALLTLVFGLPLYAVLMWFERRAPLLPTGPDLTRPGLRSREVAVWVGSAVLSFALVLAVDWRTVAVNGTEFWIPISKPRPAALPAQREEFEALERLGLRARNGEVPLDEYIRAREAAKTTLGRRKTPADDATPAPIPAPVPAPPQP